MLTLTTALRSAIADLIVDSLDAGAGAGTVAIRSGTRPVDPATTATGTLLATVTLIDPAFGAASGGAATIADPVGVSAVATGTATWFRAFDSNGAACFDGLVTATGGGGDLTLTTVSIVTAMTVDITGGTITMPQGTTP